ncbi:hypothetical protein NOVOSPHI9U_70104 [Novosphingobium sp. 9U]|nr:hypothetical protein NOVOSPHI9U_70104 [Novosphingobium sp. 9U]
MLMLMGRLARLGLACLGLHRWHEVRRLYSQTSAIDQQPAIDSYVPPTKSPRFRMEARAFR